MPIADTCHVHKDAKIPYPEMVNLYGCTIGSKVFIGPFVEIQKNARINHHPENPENPDAD